MVSEKSSGIDFPDEPEEHLNRFKSDLANWARNTYGTWEEAADHLKCSEKTLRNDVKDLGKKRQSPNDGL
jgi:hypothetical protein